MTLFTRTHFTVPALLAATLLILTAVTCEATAQSPAETAEQVAARLHETYQQVDSLSFQFTQQTSGQISGRPKTGSGNALFVRTLQGPKMRWNYTAPDRQVIISDGTSVSMYFEKLKQMIISSVEQAQADILFSLFKKNGGLAESFAVLDSAPDTETTAGSGLQTIHLIPRNPDSQISMIHLWVASGSHLRRIELIDHFETKTVITIANIMINTIDPREERKITDLFTFTPPEGTEIIRQ